MRQLIFLITLFTSCSFAQDDPARPALPGDFLEHEYRIEGTRKSISFTVDTAALVTSGYVVIHEEWVPYYNERERVWVTGRTFICSGTYKYDPPSLTLEWFTRPWRYLDLEAREPGSYLARCKAGGEDQVWEEID